jgi:1-acyl-sn-glycerol-3-phosphate acyltransferase
MELRRLVRLGSVLLILVSWFVLGCALWLGLRGCQPARRQQAWARLTQAWARTLLWALGVRVRLSGAPLPTPLQPALLVANHQSYLDILICAAHFPARFVAKQELRQWPLLGALAALGGTIFLDRQSARSGVRCVYRVSQALRHGAPVQVFPEGTTTNGAARLQFKPLFFAAAIRSRRPIQPLTIALRRVNGITAKAANRQLFCWIDEDDFVRHFWRLLAVRDLEVALIVHPSFTPTRAGSIPVSAQRAQRAVQAALPPLASPPLAPTPRSGFYLDLSQV